MVCRGNGAVMTLHSGDAAAVNDAPIGSRPYCGNKLFGRKKLPLTPELRQRLPFDSIKTQSSFRLFNTNGFGYLKNNAITLQENVESIIKNVLAKRKNYQNFIDNLQSQVVQLEEENHQKSVIIENLQLYTSEKLKIIDSLAEALTETKWKRNTMRQICEEHSWGKPQDNTVLLISGTMDKISVFKSHRDRLKSCLSDLESKNQQTPLADAVKKLKSGLDRCIGAIEVAADQELLEAIENIACGSRELQPDCGSVVEIIDRLMVIRNSNCDTENVTELWNIVKDLFQKNQRLANRVTSLNVHKVSLKLQLDEMKNHKKELEIKTMTESEVVEKKQEILNQNESLIQQRWEEMDTSQEIVVQTQMAQGIDQELEDLQIEYYNHDKENRQLKTDLYNFKNELAEYQLKCDQLEKENKKLENEKNDVLEAYAKFWGHYNEKQKIKYTGKLIKGIDCLTQEIKTYEAELEKYEINNANSTVRTPVFNKTQPKSEKISRTFGPIDTNKRQTMGVFRDNVVHNFRY